MNPLDLLTVAVLAFVGFRLADAARQTFSVPGPRVAAGGRAAAPATFSWRCPVLGAVLAVATPLLAVPGFDFGWWTAIGGEGNPAVGVGRESAAPGRSRPSSRSSS